MRKDGFWYANMLICELEASVLGLSVGLFGGARGERRGRRVGQ